MTDPHASPWLTVPGAAARAHRHPVTLRRVLESGELHGHQRRRGGRWQIHVASLDAWVQGERNTFSPCGCSETARRRARRAS